MHGQLMLSTLLRLIHQRIAAQYRAVRMIHLAKRDGWRYLASLRLIARLSTESLKYVYEEKVLLIVVSGPDKERKTLVLLCKIKRYM